MAFIEVKNVTKDFGPTHALNGISLQFEKESQYVVRGASGSGKSTLMYLIGGLDRPTKGEILIDGRNLAKLSDQKLADFRNETVGFVFQFHFLLPSMTCFDNILLPAKIGGHSTSTVKNDAKQLAQELGVEHCLKKFPYQLSGGEQQRINIIRALSLRPKLLLCDEPTGNLDSENSLKVAHLLQDLARKYQSTLVVVTHDQTVAGLFPKQYVMVDGALS